MIGKMRSLYLSAGFLTAMSGRSSADVCKSRLFHAENILHTVFTRFNGDSQ